MQWIQNPEFGRKNPHWMSWFAFPIGVEAGFSSAGAGVLGTMLLMNYSEMPPSQVVGTDILFGLVLAVIGSAFHLKFGAVNAPILWALLWGGLPGVLLGCAFARKVPARRLKSVITLIALLAGLELMWDGTHTMFANRAVHAAKTTAGESTKIVAARTGPAAAIQTGAKASDK